jgi:hypothetical protein
MSRYELRAAKKKDLEFLFEVSTIAMLPVRRVNKPSFQPNLEEEFKEYAKKFIPEKIKVIQFKKTDVGRLRVVRTSDEIYIGGIQILPKFYESFGFVTVGERGTDWIMKYEAN